MAPLLLLLLLLADLLRSVEGSSLIHTSCTRNPVQTMGSPWMASCMTSCCGPGNPRTRTRHPIFPLLPGETRILPSAIESSMIHRHLWTHNRGPWGDQPPAQPVTQPPSFQPPWIHQDLGYNTHCSLEDSLCAQRPSIVSALKLPVHWQLHSNHQRSLDHTLPVEPMYEPHDFKLPLIILKTWTADQCPLDDFRCAQILSQFSTFEPPPIHRQPRTRTRHRLDPLPPEEPLVQPSNNMKQVINQNSWANIQCPVDNLTCVNVLSAWPNTEPPQSPQQEWTYVPSLWDDLSPAQMPSQLSTLEPAQFPLKLQTSTWQPSIPIMSEDPLSKPAVLKTPQINWQLLTCISHPKGKLLPLDPLTQFSTFQPLIIHHQARTSTQCPLYLFLCSEPLSQPSISEPQQNHQQLLIHTQFPLDPLLLAEPLSQDTMLEPVEIHWQPETCDRCPMELLPPLEPSSQSSIFLPLLIQGKNDTQISGDTCLLKNPGQGDVVNTDGLGTSFEALEVPRTADSAVVPFLFQWKNDTQISGDTCLLKNPGQGDLVYTDGLGTSFEALAVPRTARHAVLPLIHSPRGMAFPWPEDLGLGNELTQLSLPWIFCGALLFVDILLLSACKWWQVRENQMDLALQGICNTRQLLKKSLLDCEEALELLEMNARVAMSATANLLKEVSELNNALGVCELEHLKI